jgi:hypothetical protein
MRELGITTLVTASPDGELRRGTQFLEPSIASSALGCSSQSTRPSAIPYVAIGALGGVVTMSAIFWMWSESVDTDDSAGAAFALIPLAVGSATLGGLIGYLVYRARY